MTKGPLTPVHTSIFNDFFIFKVSDIIFLFYIYYRQFSSLQKPNAMKNVALSLMIVLIGSIGFSKDDHTPGKMEVLVNSLKYEHSGTIILRNGVGKVNIPPGFKYLEPSQAEQVLTELWGNPRNGKMTLGLLMPEVHSLINDNCCVINIQYDEIGYVKDDDADAINYEELLMQMQKESVAVNEKRQDAGFEPVSILGWAFPPYYDKQRKILHSATKVKMGNSHSNTLNYKVKMLGRKGVIVLHAIAPMSDMAQVKNDLALVSGNVSFSDTYQYQSFNPEQDQVSINGIGRLVSGNVLTKIDFKGIFVNYWYLLLIAFIAFYRPVLEEIRSYLKKEDRGLSFP
jgi:uncharacterized membrane-anchored protein